MGKDGPPANPDNDQGDISLSIHNLEMDNVPTKEDSVMEPLKMSPWGTDILPCTYEVVESSQSKPTHHGINTKEASMNVSDDTMENVGQSIDSRLPYRIDSRLPYRIGSPLLPVLPAETQSPTQQDRERYFPDSRTHLEMISRRILRDRNIQIIFMQVAYRFNYGHVLTDNHLTLLLLSDYTDGCENNWVEAVKDIREYLDNNSISLAIELIDPRAYHGLQVSPILSTDGMVIDAWREIRPAIFTVVQDRDWKAIDILHREFPSPSRNAAILFSTREFPSPSRNKKPTIIFSARDANDPIWWDETLPSLRRLLQEKNLDLDILLMFYKDIYFAQTDDDNNDCVPPNLGILERCYGHTIRMGSSCGIGETDYGTLGGGIKLRTSSSEEIELGLTNYHVVQDALPTKNPTKNPSGPFQPGVYGPACVPANVDHNTIVNSKKADLGMLEEDMVEEEATLLAAQPTVPTSSYLQANFSERQGLTDWIGHAEEFQRHIGHVYAASGGIAYKNSRYPDGLRDNWALDWGLIRIDPPKTISRKLWNVLNATQKILNEAKVTQFCSISPSKEYRVMKCGRSSGWTKGTISACESAFKGSPLNIDAVRFDNGSFANKVVYSHTIVCEKEAAHRMFMNRGDSGCFVLLDQSPQVPIVGLGFGGNLGTGVSYMIPMDLVVKTIQEVTKGTVTEPTYAGDV